MIQNNNPSKMPVNGDYIDVKKYIGVASVSILCVNPSNSVLRKYGWEISDDADEPKYSYLKQNDNGEYEQYARVRFLLRINDLEDKPVVPYDIWIRPDFIVGKNTGKCRVIDSFGRCAWATKEECKTRAIPQYSSGPAAISNDYKGCHPGQEKLIALLFKYLNITPLQIFDKKANNWVNSKNPGRLTIDNWKNLCDGNAEEIAEYLSLQPDNRVKVIFGVRTTEDNKTYQVVLDDCDGTTKMSFIGNAVTPDKNSGEYILARKRIDSFFEENPNTDCSFSAKPVREWTISPTDVQETIDDAPNTSYVKADPDLTAVNDTESEAERDLPF